MQKRSSDTPKKAARVPRFPAPGVHFVSLSGHDTVKVSTDEAARITSSSVRTVNRWRRAGVIPPACLRLLQLHQAGMIVPESWRLAPCAFTLTGDLVVGGYVFKRGELEGYGVMLQALKSLQRARDASHGVDAAPLLTLLPGGRQV